MVVFCKNINPIKIPIKILIIIFLLLNSTILKVKIWSEKKIDSVWNDEWNRNIFGHKERKRIVKKQVLTG